MLNDAKKIASNFSFWIDEKRSSCFAVISAELVNLISSIMTLNSNSFSIAYLSESKKRVGEKNVNQEETFSAKVNSEEPTNENCSKAS